jgi:2,3-diaminopropionate biosynthesis protein SbnB
MSAPPHPFAVITAETILPLIREDLSGCIAVVRDAYLAHAEGRGVNPRSVFMRFADRPDCRIIALPSHLGTPWKTSGLKWVASYPGNVARGIPRASAVLLLNDHEFGYPFACLEGSVISAARTAASAVLAASHLRSGDHHVGRFGIVGTGLIARYVLRFLLGTEWKIGTVELFDIDPSRAERFAASARAMQPDMNMDVRIAPDLPTLLKASDLLLFATVASRPHVYDPQLLAHRPVVLHISLRDLAPAVVVDAFNIVDDVDHVMREDTSLHLTEQLTGTRNVVAASLAAVIAGRCRVDRARPVVFSPFGLGVLDLAVGTWVYERARAAGKLVAMEHFFSDAEL